MRFPVFHAIAHEWNGGSTLAPRIAIYVLASWLIAAHFLCMEDLPLVALCLATPVFFLVRRSWSVRLLQFLAYVACGIWLLTAWHSGQTSAPRDA